MSDETLQPAFADPVAGSQAAFRGLLNAFSYPGTVRTLARPEGWPAPLDPTTGAALLTLVDRETPLWLDPPSRTEAVRRYLAFHTGVSVTEAAEVARFAVIVDPAGAPGLDGFSPGDPAYPDRSATVILQLPALDGARRSLSGPGIETTRSIAPAGLSETFWSQWARNNALFPCGVDLLLVSGDRILALPRTTRAKTED